MTTDYPLMRNRNLAILTISHFSHDLCFGILPAILPFIRDALNLNYTQVGGLVGALTITAGLSQFLGGWLGDRFPRRILVTIGLGGMSLCTFIVGFLSDFGLLILLFILMGLFAGLYHPSATVLLSGSVKAGQRGKAIAVHMVGGSLGYIVAPLVGGMLASSFGWQAAFITLSFSASITAVISFYFLETNLLPIVPKSDTPDAKKKAPWYGIITISCMSILMEIISGAAVAFFALFLVDVQNITPEGASYGLALLRIGSLIGSLFGGYATDRWGNNRAILWSFIASGPSLLLLSYLGSIPFFAIVFFFGLFYTMREVAVQVYLLEKAPENIKSRLIGIYYGFGMEGSSLLQPLVGFTMDRFGIINIYIWLGVASTIISLITPALLLIGVRRYSKE
jgi:FSR family fosmidomycin resistance protein-like MFS transporter